MNRACARCGTSPAAGFALLNAQRYCHGGSTPTCFDQTSWEEHLKGRADTVHRAALLALDNDQLELAARLLIITAELRGDIAVTSTQRYLWDRVVT